MKIKCIFYFLRHFVCDFLTENFACDFLLVYTGKDGDRMDESHWRQRTRTAYRSVGVCVRSHGDDVHTNTYASPIGSQCAPFGQYYFHPKYAYASNFKSSATWWCDFPFASTHIHRACTWLLLLFQHLCDNNEWQCYRIAAIGPSHFNGFSKHVAVIKIWNVT